MPPMCLINKHAIKMLTSYREYFAYRACCRGVTDARLPGDVIFKNFMKIIDSTDIFDTFLYFWSDEVLTFLKDKDYNTMYKTFESCMNHFYIMFSSKEYQFN